LAVGGRQPGVEGQLGDSLPVRDKYRVRKHEHAVDSLPHDGGERRGQVLRSRDRLTVERNAQSLRDLLRLRHMQVGQRLIPRIRQDRILAKFSRP
jgi:hypothetical protein